MPQNLSDCEHENRYEICGQIVCPTCYHDELTTSKDKVHHKGQYKLEYVYDSTKHMNVPKKVRREQGRS